MGVKVNAFAVPPSQPVNSERMAQVAWPWTDAATRWLESGLSEQRRDRLPSRAVGKSFPADTDEHPVAGTSSFELMAYVKVLRELMSQRRMKGDPSSTPLGFLDEDHVASKVDITDPKAQGLTETKAGAVQNEKQRSVERGTKQWAFQLACESQHKPNVDRSEHMGDEPRLGR